jgi:hypothetical protein
MTQHSEASEPVQSAPTPGGLPDPTTARGGTPEPTQAGTGPIDPTPTDPGNAERAPAGSGPFEPADGAGGCGASAATDRGSVAPEPARWDLDDDTGLPDGDPDGDPAPPAGFTLRRDPMLNLGHVSWRDHPEAGPCPPASGGKGAAPRSGGEGSEHIARAASNHRGIAAGAVAEQVTLRSAAELADALPYLLGYRPEDSIVLVTIHDRHGFGSFGGRAHLGIPARDEDWPEVARQMARCLVSGCERRGMRPEGMVAFVCREPVRGDTGRQVMETLRPLAQLLRTECGSLDIPVLEALCISDGRFWSYCCPGTQCCPRDGTPMGLPGSSVLSAAMTYAGLQVRGTLKEFRARLMPWETAAALDQQSALDAAGMTLAPRILDDAHRAQVATDTIDLGRRLMGRLACAPHVRGILESDQQDDELIAHDEAATLIFGLQDRTTRDRAAEWMEGDVAAPALRLWRSLARRCVGPYGEYAAAPLTLAGWVAWSLGDELEAREALAMALGANPDYTLARLLHQACNEGLGPEAIRRCLRRDTAPAMEGAVPVDVGSAKADHDDPAPIHHDEPGPAVPHGGRPLPTESETGPVAAAGVQATPQAAARPTKADDPRTVDVELEPDSVRPRRPGSRRSGPRGAAGRGPRPVRPMGDRAAGTHPGAPRPRRGRTTGRGGASR